MAINDGKAQREELVLSADKVALCRCWQSSKFPYCDGSHHQYNKEHGDDLGPIIVRKDVIVDK
jgi:CDGSH-type Zn-finger protein